MAHKELIFGRYAGEFLPHHVKVNVGDNAHQKPDGPNPRADPLPARGVFLKVEEHAAGREEGSASEYRDPQKPQGRDDAEVHVDHNGDEQEYQEHVKW